MTGKITGILTPHMVPLDAAGEINETELRRYVDWLIERGVHGLYPNGSTGEFVRFTPEERRRIAKIVCEQTAGRVPVIVGAAEANTRETIKACEAYSGFGARAVAVVSPFYYRLSPESVYAYFREIAVNSPIDVTLYNIPLFASPIDLPTIRRLSEIESVVGIKDSSGDLPFMMRMMASIRPHRPVFSFLAGWEAVLVPMLLAGVDGGTHASSGVVPELTRRIFDLAKAKQWNQATALQRRLLEVFDLLLGTGDFPEGFRAGVEVRGFAMGPGRQPLGPDQKASLKRLREQLRAFLPVMTRLLQSHED
jgi:4-hydroxy-tetrahydrodipicolinate synthase